MKSLEGLSLDLEGLPSSLEGLPPNMEGLQPSLGGLPLSLGGFALSSEEIGKILALRGRMKPKMKPTMVEQVIAELCAVRAFTRLQIAEVLGRHEVYIKRFLSGLLKSGVLEYSFPEMSTNPHQAYRTVQMPGSGGGRILNTNS